MKPLLELLTQMALDAIKDKIKLLSNNMEIKYYLPSIEEFHIGFRYDLWYGDTQIWEAKEFKGYFGRITGILDNTIQDDTVRVKYLDKSDIEELGWIGNSNIIKVDNYFELKDYSLLFLHGILVITCEDKVKGIRKNGEYHTITLFHGIIRNYNELKTLMNQLKII